MHAVLDLPPADALILGSHPPPLDAPVPVATFGLHHGTGFHKQVQHDRHTDRHGVCLGAIIHAMIVLLGQFDRNPCPASSVRGKCGAGTALGGLPADTLPAPSRSNALRVVTADPPSSPYGLRPFCAPGLLQAEASAWCAKWSSTRNLRAFFTCAVRGWRVVPLSQVRVGNSFAVGTSPLPNGRPLDRGYRWTSNTSPW